MTMSRDRVRFTLTDNRSNVAGTSRAAQRAFGMSCSQVYHALRTEQVIICRPSQFARFMIYRSEEVTCNTFQQFKAELIPAEEHAPIIDVSKREAA